MYSPLRLSSSTNNTYIKRKNRHFNASHKAQEQCAAAESELLRQQRKLRPVSPHLQIYQPQITWYLSGLHRVTGVALGGGKLKRDDSLSFI